MSVLVRAFREEAASGAAGRVTYDTADLAGTLAALYARGRAAHPKLAVSEEAFGRRLARAMDGGPPRQLDALAVEDLYLACACAERVRGAAAAFEAEYAKVVRRAVSRAVAARDDREEAEQRVRQYLLVAAPGAGPGVARYPGHVALAKWVSVVAIRVAISLKRSESAEQRLREKAGAEAIGVSPEQLLMKEEIRCQVEEAVSAALRRLPGGDRLVLQLFLVAGITHRAIAKSLGVSQQAVSRQIATTRDHLLDDIRRTVAAKLKIPKDEVTSILRLVASQLDVSLSRALAAP
jgi:RNA polymerase sigma-70 factor (ECF subfamily)